jgi:ribonuclease-3
VNLADDESKDNKTLLQELTQARFKARPIYTLIRSIGPEHQATYVVEVLLPDKTRIQASASTVRKAEQQAAHKALSLLHNRH